MLSPKLCATLPGKISCGYIHNPQSCSRAYADF